MVSPRPLLTAEDYLAHDDGTDTRYEFVDGQLVEMPPESPENQTIARFLLVQLLQHFSLQYVVYNTEVEVTGRLARYRIPDLLVHSEESLAALRGAARSTLTRDMPPPALVIEIVSPGEINRNRDYRYKHTEYAARAIAEYWIVDPGTRQVTVCEWVEGRYENLVFEGDRGLQSKTVPALQLTTSRLFTVAES